MEINSEAILAGARIAPVICGAEAVEKPLELFFFLKIGSHSCIE